MENNNIIESVFNEIRSEALNNEIILKEYEEGIGLLDTPVRIGFVFNEEREGYISLKSNDEVRFYKLLKEYAYNALIFYGLEPNRNNIKKVITYLLSNVANYELDDLNSFLEKRINFFIEDSLKFKKVSNPCSLGNIIGYVDNQSILQETPLCFKSSFIDGDKRYNLPRISFGIDNNTCYIYAIQNKDVLSEDLQDSNYNELVHRTMRTINSGVKKYRNVTPSFVIALTYFISYLNQNNITNIRTIPSMPTRIENRKLVNKYKVNRMISKGTITSDVEEFKEQLENKRINDVYNATKKFSDCFERLKVHFSGIFIENVELTDELLLEVSSLVTSNELLREIVAESKTDMIK